MQASPTTSLGTSAQMGPAAPIAIEGAAGKRQYVARQREFTRRGGELRRRIGSAIQVARRSRRLRSAPNTTASKVC